MELPLPIISRKNNLDSIQDKAYQIAYSFPGNPIAGFAYMEILLSLTILMSLFVFSITTFQRMETYKLQKLKMVANKMREVNDAK